MSATRSHPKDPADPAEVKEPEGASRPAGDRVEGGAAAGLKDADLARLARLAEMLAVLRRHLTYVDYAAAEHACERLASRLLAERGNDVRDFAYRPIPRGGLIVLGMLSYLLDLPASAFAPQTDSGRPLVIVDDCALSGARFRRELESTGARDVTFAHLYSPPELRAAILRAEPVVGSCVAAHDLQNRLDRYLPEPHMQAEWNERWQRRAGAGRYWLGCPDVVSFAWSEPDRPFWNPITDRLEDGWRFVSPDRCLKNRAALGVPPVARGAREWRVPQEVVVGEFDGSLWLWNGGEDGVFALAGVGADMWRALAGLGDPAAALDFLQARYEVDGDHLRRDLERFAESLVDRRLLESVDRRA